MIQFATQSGHPVFFDTDMKLVYDTKTGLLIATRGELENEKPVHFLDNGRHTNVIQLAGMNEEQFLRLCGMMCAATVKENTRFTYGSEAGIVHVSFVQGPVDGSAM